MSKGLVDEDASLAAQKYTSSVLVNESFYPRTRLKPSNGTPWKLVNFLTPEVAGETHHLFVRSRESVRSNLCKLNNFIETKGSTPLLRPANRDSVLFFIISVFRTTTRFLIHLTEIKVLYVEINCCYFGVAVSPKGYAMRF